jgi:hypothetical protein
VVECLFDWMLSSGSGAPGRCSTGTVAGGRKAVDTNAVPSPENIFGKADT